MIPAILYSLALLDTLFIQSTSSALAGVWFPLFLAGSFILVYNRENRFSKKHRWLFAWTVAIVIGTFFITPIKGGSLYIWAILALPAVALTVEDPKYILRGFTVVLGLYAVDLIILECVNGGRVSWPLLDPNNSAAIMNTAFIPCVWQCMKERKSFTETSRLWPFAALLFGAALLFTGSLSGLAAAAICCFFLAWYRFGHAIFFITVFSLLLAGSAAFIYDPAVIADSASRLAGRYTTWQAAYQLLWYHPFRGVGIGQYYHYWVQISPHTYGSNIFAHNDLMQFAIELGFPVTFVFIGLLVNTFRRATKETAPAIAVMGSVLLQSMTEFQFYLPAVGILFGAALAYHISKLDIAIKNTYPN